MEQNIKKLKLENTNAISNLEIELKTLEDIERNNNLFLDDLRKGIIYFGWLILNLYSIYNFKNK